MCLRVVVVLCCCLGVFSAEESGGGTSNAGQQELVNGTLVNAGVAGYGAAASGSSSETESPVPAGIIPFKVSVADIPPAVTEANATLAIIHGMTVANCFLDDWRVGVDTCPGATLNNLKTCVRFTSYFPFGIMEGSDRYGHTGLNFKGQVDYMNQMLPKITAVSKLMDKTHVGDQVSQSRIAHTVGRATAPPLGVATISAIIQVITFGQGCQYDFLLKANTGIYWFMSDIDRGPGGGWKSTVSPYLRGPLAGMSNTSLMWTRTGYSMVDYDSFLTWGQCADNLGRSSTGHGSAIANMLRAMSEAWMLISSPMYIPWGLGHDDIGGPMRWPYHDSQSVSSAGMLAQMPKMRPGMKMQMLYPTDSGGCPDTECYKYYGLGEQGTNPRFLGLYLAEQRSAPVGRDNLMAILLYPYITCCVLCISDVTETAKRHTNFNNDGTPKLGDGFMNEYVPQIFNSSLSQDEEDKRQAKRDENKKAADAKRKEDANKRKEAANTRQGETAAQKSERETTEKANPKCYF